MAEVEILGEANAGIAHHQHTGARAGLPQGNLNLPRPPVREGVFECIRDQFFEDQPTGYRVVNLQPYLVGLQL